MEFAFETADCAGLLSASSLEISSARTDSSVRIPDVYCGNISVPVIVTSLLRLLFVQIRLLLTNVPLKAIHQTKCHTPMIYDTTVIVYLNCDSYTYCIIVL